MTENNNSIWIIVAIVLLLAVGAFFMFSGENPATESEGTGAEIEVR